jgi:hypothetical protein
MKKRGLFFLFAILSFSLSAQIAITEVYYDSPFIERIHQSPDYAHLGEFIELYNYTTKDIDITGWRLSDGETSYFLPQETIIKSNDFIIIARKVKGINNYFFGAFPRERSGNERKVFYQDKIILNNYKESVRLYSNYLAGQKLKRYHLIDKVEWFCEEENCDINPYYLNKELKTIFQGEFDTDFSFYLPSYQRTEASKLKSFKKFQNTNIATPFKLNFQVKLEKLENLDNVKEILIKNHESLNSNDIAKRIITTTCNRDINSISSQSVSDSYVEEICFSYDTAGNQDSIFYCEDGKDDTTVDDIVISLEEIANRIYVSPNPTTGVVNISWEQEVNNLIAGITVSPMNGSSLDIPVTILSSNSAQFNLTTYSDGFYAVRFVLNSNQTITKTVIKI